MSKETRIVLFEKQLFNKPFEFKHSEKKRLFLFIQGIGGIDVLFGGQTPLIHLSMHDIVNKANTFIKNNGNFRKN